MTLPNGQRKVIYALMLGIVVIILFFIVMGWMAK